MCQHCFQAQMLSLRGEEQSLTSRVFCKDSVRLRNSFFSSSTPLRERAVSSSSLKKQKGWQLLTGNNSPADRAQAVRAVVLLVQDLQPSAGIAGPGEPGVCQEASHLPLDTLQVSRNFTVPPDHQTQPKSYCASPARAWPWL